MRHNLEHRCLFVIQRRKHCRKKLQRRESVGKGGGFGQCLLLAHSHRFCDLILCMFSYVTKMAGDGYLPSILLGDVFSLVSNLKPFNFSPKDRPPGETIVIGEDAAEKVACWVVEILCNIDDGLKTP